MKISIGKREIPVILMSIDTDSCNNVIYTNGSIELANKRNLMNEW